MGRITGQQEALIDAAVAALERHIARSATRRKEEQRIYQLIPMTDSLIQLATVLCRKYRGVQPHALRALDAIQLASAVTVRQLIRQKSPANGDTVVFVSADSRLLAIAAAEGFPLENPALHP